MKLPLTPGAYDASTRRWRAVEPAQKNSLRDTLSFATFNIWFGDYFTNARHRAIARLLEARRPDFIGLQEVTWEALDLLLNQPWIQDNYLISDIDGSTLDDYGVLILSRLPLKSISLTSMPSSMQRQLLLVEAEINGRPFQVGTVHLESQKSSAAMRGRQLETVFETLHDAPDAVVMGDFNFCASWPNENSRIDPAYTDLWDELRSDEPGYTEDTEINEMRYLIKGKHKQVRFDRVLLKSQDQAWSAAAIDLLGTDPIWSNQPDVFPSDHFGLWCQIAARQD